MILLIWLCVSRCMCRRRCAGLMVSNSGKSSVGMKNQSAKRRRSAQPASTNANKCFVFFVSVSLFSLSSCCFSTGGGVGFQPIHLSYYTSFSLCKSTTFVWILVQCVSKLPRLPSWFLAPSPPWDWPLYVFPSKSGSQVSWGTQFKKINKYSDNFSIPFTPTCTVYL